MIGQFLTYSIALWEIFPEMVYFPIRKNCRTDELKKKNILMSTLDRTKCPTETCFKMAHFSERRTVPICNMFQNGTQYTHWLLFECCSLYHRCWRKESWTKLDLMKLYFSFFFRILCHRNRNVPKATTKRASRRLWGAFFAPRQEYLHSCTGSTTPTHRTSYLFCKYLHILSTAPL